MLTYFKPWIFGILVVLKTDLLFGKYIKFGIIVGLENRVELYFGIIIKIGFVVIFLYLSTWNPRFVVEKNSWIEPKYFIISCAFLIVYYL